MGFKIYSNIAKFGSEAQLRSHRHYSTLAFLCKEKHFAVPTRNQCHGCLEGSLPSVPVSD